MHKGKENSSVSDPDPYKDMPPGSGFGSTWTDAKPDQDPGGKKASGSLGEHRTGNIKARILL